MNTVNVVYWFVPGKELNILEDLATSINSIKIHRNITRDYRVYVCHNKLSSDYIKKLTTLSAKNFTVDPIQVSEFYYIKSNQHVWSVINKIYALKHMSSLIDKCVYTDMDVLLRSDIGYFYDFDLQGSVFAGFEDYPLVVNKLRDPGYTNFGFITVDLKKFVKYDLAKLCQDSLGNRYFEQDESNKVLPHITFPDDLLSFAKIANENLSKDVLSSVSKASVVHYTGFEKGRTYKIPEDLRCLWESYTPAGFSPKLFVSSPEGDNFGDNILFADVIYNINRCLPNVCVETQCNDGTANVLTACGCSYTRVYSIDTSRYWRIIHPTLQYNPLTEPHQHILSKMMVDLCHKGHFNTSIFSPIKLASCIYQSTIETPENYVIVPSVEPSKRDVKYNPPRRDSYQKNVTCWEDIVFGLSVAGFNVYEINTWVDHPKVYSRSSGIIYTTKLQDSAKLLKNAKFTVCIENGLNHWACHNGGRTYCIFKSPYKTRYSTPEDLYYKTMTPIDCYTDSSAQHIVDVILHHEGLTKEHEK